MKLILREPPAPSRFCEFAGVLPRFLKAPTAFIALTLATDVYSQFVQTPVPGLPGIPSGSLAWGDYDRDGRLDFLFTGTSDASSTGAICQVWRNTGAGFVNVAVRHANGIFEFSFRSTPGASFTALAATNLSLNLVNWTPLGAPAEVSPGQFQFTDSQAPNHPRRFYIVRSP